MRDDSIFRGALMLALGFVAVAAVWIAVAWPARARSDAQLLAAACFAESGWCPAECRNAIVPTYHRRAAWFRARGRRVSLRAVVAGHSRPLRPGRAPRAPREAFAAALPESLSWDGFRSYRRRFRALESAVAAYLAGDWVDWCPGAVDIGGPHDTPPRGVEPVTCAGPVRSRYYRPR